MKQMKGFVVGFLAAILLVTSVFAAPISKRIDIVYDSIKLQIDGKVVTPKDAAGNTVEPFTYNGTTYLPVRAIANALDKNVSWDAKSKTVIISSKNQDSAATPPDATKPTIEFLNTVTKSNYGMTTVYGEAKNNDTKAHTFTLKVTFYDASNKILGTASGAINDLNPGATKTFSAIGLEDYSNAASLKVQTDSVLTVSEFNTNIVSFSEPNITTQYGMTTIDVDVTNKDTKAHTLTVTVTFYDKSQKIIGTASGVMNDIKPGEIKTLTCMSSDDLSNYKSYKIQIDSNF